MRNLKRVSEGEGVFLFFFCKIGYNAVLSSLRCTSSIDHMIWGIVFFLS